MANNTPIPSGAYVELNVDLVSEGALRREIDRRIGQAFRELLEREQATGDKTGKAVVTAQIVIERGKDSEQFWRIRHKVQHAVPPITQMSLVKGVNGRLICQPEGAGKDDPDQMKLFDAQGRCKGVFDPQTGEIVEEPDVAGKVG